MLKERAIQNQPFYCDMWNYIAFAKFKVASLPMQITLGLSQIT